MQLFEQFFMVFAGENIERKTVPKLTQSSELQIISVSDQIDSEVVKLSQTLLHSQHPKYFCGVVTHSFVIGGALA